MAVVKENGGSAITVAVKGQKAYNDGSDKRGDAARKG